MAYDSTVARWQATLSALGFSSGVVDGVWGPRTAQAVRDFRAAAGLYDPEAGPDADFEAALFRATQARGITVNVPTSGGGGGSPMDPSAPAPEFPIGKTLGILLLLGAGGLLLLGRKR